MVKFLFLQHYSVQFFAEGLYEQAFTTAALLGLKKSDLVFFVGISMVRKFQKLLLLVHRDIQFPFPSLHLRKNLQLTNSYITAETGVVSPRNWSVRAAFACCT